jgi:hypothetical protein
VSGVPVVLVEGQVAEVAELGVAVPWPGEGAECHVYGDRVFECVVGEGMRRFRIERWEPLRLEPGCVWPFQDGVRRKRTSEVEADAFGMACERVGRVGPRAWWVERWKSGEDGLWRFVVEAYDVRSPRELREVAEPWLAEVRRLDRELAPLAPMRAGVRSSGTKTE